MLNVETGIRSLTEFKQNSTEILDHLKKTHSPTILTVNGRAEVVLVDPKSYQKMVEELYLLDSAKRIDEAISRIDEDEGIEAKEFFANLRKRINEKEKK